MNKASLMASAACLIQPPPEVVAEFAEKRQAMAAMVNREMNARNDLLKLVGVDGVRMSEDNNPEVLVDTALWVFRSYRSHGFAPIYWPANLDTWVEVLRRELSPQAFAAIFVFYRWLIINIPVFTALTDAEITSSQKSGGEHCHE
jgi:hypothetical protein